MALFLTIILSVLLILTYKLFEKVNIDAKFVGMLVPVFVSLFDFRNLNVSIFWKKFDCLWVKIICLAIGLLIFGIEFKYLNIQFYCMCSLFFIVFYNGKLGYKGAKYGFYVYYPMHLIVLEGINLFI